MTLLQALILGAVQGVTEFFPISSSGHLVIIQNLFGLKDSQFAFDVFLHFGTLLATLMFFWKDILNLFLKEKRALYFLIIASIPTAVIGFIFKDVVEKFFMMPKIVGYMLILTGMWLFLATFYSKYLEKRGSKRNLNATNSLAIGIAQGVAIMPGISRSGATIATGILTGLDREFAFKFSFLLSLPAVFGANLVKAHRIGLKIAGKDAVYFMVGGLAAMVVGLASLKLLSKLVKNNKLYLFGIYCILAGSFIIILFQG